MVDDVLRQAGRRLAGIGAGLSAGMGAAVNGIMLMAYPSAIGDATLEGSRAKDLYGPFYRYETDAKYVIQAEETSFIYGTQPRNGGAWPTIQAYKSDIKPLDPLRVEFYTPVAPESTGPIQHWYPSTPGVIPHNENTIKIPVIVTSTGPR